MKVPYAMEVDCTPEVLWTYLTDPSKQKQWMKGLESVEREGDGPLAPGSSAKMLIKEGGKIAEYRSTISECEYPRHLALAVTGKTFGDCPMNLDYRLTDLAGRTRLDYLCSFEPKKFFMKLFMGLLAPFMRKQLISFMGTLKQLAEAEAKGALALP
jgi:carbon monoxide dehydrogenase subunit G